MSVHVDIQILKLLTSTALGQFNSIIFIRDREVVNLDYFTFSMTYKVVHDILAVKRNAQVKFLKYLLLF